MRVRGRGTIRYEEIRKITKSPHFSAGRQFWTWPDRAEIESALANEKLDLWNLPKNERALIRKLMSVFRTVEAVSVILRFLVPKDYGILSGPVEHVLGTQPSTTSLDKYLSYVRDLRAIRKKYQFDTAAQVDQALWTLHVGVHRGFLPATEHLKKAHSKDKFLKSIRVKNLAGALFGEMPRLELADSLAEHRPGLAGQLAAIEFERAVRHYSGASSERELWDIIETDAPDHLRGYWHWCRSRRNDTIHRRDLDHHEVQDLIRHTRDVLALPRVRC